MVKTPAAEDQNSGIEDSVDVSPIETPATASPSFSRRLTDIFLEDGDDDLLLQRTDIGEGFMQWLGALNMQVMGACRADERLKPLLKLKISGGEAEDRLLAQLCEHFEPSEVGLLARCLCVPLVSIRVGKINKQGTLLCPTSLRGNLCLTLLPTSNHRVSFNGDDGSMEILATLSSGDHCTSLEMEEIFADNSRRSFLLRTVDDVVFYFWCSEKYQFLGNEMLKKMKDLLVRKPSLAELTGISDDRLNSFATQLRTYLGGSIASNAPSSGVLPSSCPSDDDSLYSAELYFPQSSVTYEKSSESEQYGLRGSVTDLNHLNGLYPNSDSSEMSMPNKLSSKNVTAREKLIQFGDNSAFPNSLSLAATINAELSNSIGLAKGKLPEANSVHPFSALNAVDAFNKPLDLPLCGSKVQVHSSRSSHFSPLYCWCPPAASTLHYTLRTSQMSTESLHLPPLSSLLTSKSSLSLSDFPAMEFPSFQPEPFITSLATSQQIPTFTPLMCDPIIHIPIYSSSPGYLVSSGLALSNHVDPLISSSESAAEQSSRETLRMLINSTNSQPNSKLLEMLPPMLSSNGDKPNILSIGGSKGFSSVTRGVHAVSGGPTNNTSFMFLTEKSKGGGFRKVCSSRDDSVDDKEKPHEAEDWEMNS
ncbi:hypothetical protein SASPL_101476 [Salvia splendens]|uniref:Uncharacterized protein n=1 Tax=Salvia splendens TaxID=180675 RepID=A0A8X8YPG1_SALSN|nr:uncharacterized protein LOC121744107 [Salvia splendens]KAG6436575.1 hypothetical protein SASPL_101476 [Salvia splendens]